MPVHRDNKYSWCVLHVPTENYLFYASFLFLAPASDTVPRTLGFRARLRVSRPQAPPRIIIQPFAGVVRERLFTLSQRALHSVVRSRSAQRQRHVFKWQHRVWCCPVAPSDQFAINPALGRVLGGGVKGHRRSVLFVWIRVNATYFDDTCAFRKSVCYFAQSFDRCNSLHFCPLVSRSLDLHPKICSCTHVSYRSCHIYLSVAFCPTTTHKQSLPRTTRAGRR